MSGDVILLLVIVVLFVVAVVVFGKVIVKGALIVVALAGVYYLLARWGWLDDIIDSVRVLANGVRVFVETGRGETP